MIGGVEFSPLSCNIYAFIQSRKTDSSASFLYLIYDISDGATDKHLSLSINNFLVDGSGINDSGIVINSLNYPVKSAYFNSLTLNGKNFSNVQLIEKDTTGFKTPGLYKIWLAKNTGAIGYEEYPSLTRWVKQ